MVNRKNRIHQKARHPTRRLRRYEKAHPAVKCSDVNAIWPRRKVTITKRLRIYKTIVKSILTHNFATWGLTKAEEAELDRAHRKQLRRVWNDPHKRNKQLYEQSGEKKLSSDMRKARWSALGHMLRRHEETPCRQSMEDYFNVPENAKKYPGRKRNTLPIVIDNDIKTASAKCRLIQFSKFEDSDDLQTLKLVANNISEWRKVCDLISIHADGVAQF